MEIVFVVDGVVGDFGVKRVEIRHRWRWVAVARPLHRRTSQRVSLNIKAREIEEVHGKGIDCQKET